MPQIDIKWVVVKRGEELRSRENSGVVPASRAVNQIHSPDAKELPAFLQAFLRVSVNGDPKERLPATRLAGQGIPRVRAGCLVGCGFDSVVAEDVNLFTRTVTECQLWTSSIRFLRIRRDRRYDGIRMFPALRAYTFHRDALRVLDAAVGADPTIASEVERLEERDVERYASIISTTAGYRPVGDSYRVSLLVNAMGDELARRWICSERCSGDPAVDDPELQRLARLFALMCTAALDPTSLGISESAISEVMERVAPNGHDGSAATHV